MSCDTTHHRPPILSSELDDATRALLGQLMELRKRRRDALYRKHTAMLSGGPESKWLLQEEVRPSVRPEHADSLEYARWRADTRTTYGYPLGLVVALMPPREGLPVRFIHDPFGFPAEVPGSLDELLVSLHSVQHGFAMTAWMYAHGHALARALLQDWTAALQEDERRGLPAPTASADADQPHPVGH